MVAKKMRTIINFLESSPIAEVLVKKLYWNSPSLIKWGKKIRPHKLPVSRSCNTHTFSKILEFLGEEGLATGRLLLVHSSAEALWPMGLSLDEIIDRLLDQVGNSGTLAMPSFPKYRDLPKSTNLITQDLSNLILTFDVQKSRPWTGALPFTLMQRNEAIRSRHPLNTMVSLGKHAQAMMAKNLSGRKPLPCGVNSSWKYCADNNALIVGLGVDLAHSLTMIHVEEDCFEDEWPIRDWYRERTFRIVDKGNSEEITVRERHPKWAINFAERTMAKDLRKSGILKNNIIDGISIEIIETSSLIRFLSSRKHTAYPYFMIPRSEWKRCDS